MDSKTRANQRTWDKVADQFVDGSSLPVWGPFGVGKKLDLLGDVMGKTYLEIGCGSGRSIKYLIERGAKKVYGLDFSSVQIEESEKYNKMTIEAGKVQLFNLPMEDPLNIELVDTVFSIYAIGWTLDPEKTFKNIYSYLNPVGNSYGVGIILSLRMLNMRMGNT